ncbi:MAG: hypothetical protein GY730_10365 [bacterium]|nr:hypothetical protein [bacterium]
MLNYQQTINKLVKYSSTRGINYNLNNLFLVLNKIGNPQHNLTNVIHIAGTNGKGSTLTYIAAVLKEAGFKTGTFTSPHITDYTERLCINFKAISKNSFCLLFNEVMRHTTANIRLTEFEMLTIMSILYFKKNNPDFIIYEAGLGGRLDTTNIFNPVLSIITKVDLDHQNILGRNLSSIAKEKAGIIKAGVPVITIKQNARVLKVISNTALQKDAPLTIISPLKKIPETYNLKGDFQAGNLALAKSAVKYLANIFPALASKDLVSSGLQKAYIKGRYSKVIKGHQTIIVDSAHNPAAVRMLIKSLKKDFPDKKVSFLVGFLRRKKVFEMLNILIRYSSSIYYCPFEPALCYPFSKLTYDKKRATVYEYDPRLFPELPDEKILVITGSIYFISNFQKLLCIYRKQL